MEICRDIIKAIGQLHFKGQERFCPKYPRSRLTFNDPKFFPLGLIQGLSSWVEAFLALSKSRHFIWQPPSPRSMEPRLEKWMRSSQNLIWRLFWGKREDVGICLNYIVSALADLVAYFFMLNINAEGKLLFNVISDILIFPLLASVKFSWQDDK